MSEGTRGAGIENRLRAHEQTTGQPSLAYIGGTTC